MEQYVPQEKWQLSLLILRKKTRLWSYNPRVAQIVAALIELKHFSVIRCTLIKLSEKKHVFFLYRFIFNLNSIF